jgi:hypothetical protein
VHCSICSWPQQHKRPTSGIAPRCGVCQAYQSFVSGCLATLFLAESACPLLLCGTHQTPNSHKCWLYCCEQKLVTLINTDVKRIESAQLLLIQFGRCQAGTSLATPLLFLR